MADIKILDLAPSPNNMKVRIGLSYKGIPFERVAVALDDAERAGVIAETGQPLTPALIHGDVRLFDSSAILRYIDANFRDTGPRLFSETREGMREIERWERFGQADCIAGVGLTFEQAVSGFQVDEAKKKQANESVAKATEKLEGRLAESPWLAGDAMTAADIICAPPLFYAMLPASLAEQGPFMKFFHDHLEMPAGREKTRDWVMRVMAHDK